MVDYYGVNPLNELFAEREPEWHAAISKNAAPPKMFGAGSSDLPAFTASGIDPSTLSRLPFQLRHAAAMEPDVMKVYAMFEQYAADPTAEIPSDGLTDYRLRMEKLLRETDPRPPEEAAAEQAQKDAAFEAYERSQYQGGVLPRERQAQRAAEQEAAARAAAPDGLLVRERIAKRNAEMQRARELGMR